MVEGPVIGIDLGTSYSCVGVFQNDEVEIIVNDMGRKVTPCYVAFADGEILIGGYAKQQATRNLKNTIFDTKRLIGRTFDDASVQADIKHWPFEVIDDDNNPKIQVEFLVETKTFYPEQISSMVLGKMKEIAETHLGETVSKAVITVPAYFDDAQRQATKDAGRIAGLEVLSIINEPTAAAIAYGFDKNNNGLRNILVFDLGRDTFNVSILSVQNGVFEVKSTAGYTHWGGENFDDRMVNYFVQEFNSINKKDLRQNRKAMRRLKAACKRVKKTLSANTAAEIDIEALHEGIDLYSVITRSRFEELCADLFQNILDHVKKVISDARMNKWQIHNIVLVGGSSRIPKVQNLLQNFFNGKELHQSIDPDTVVAYGAAIQAAILKGDKYEKVLELEFEDVTSLSLGVKNHLNVLGEEMVVVVKRNTTTPTRNTETSIEVYEGEFPMTKNNKFLGGLMLSGISPARSAEAKINVTFNANANGILKVTAVDKTTGNRNQITVKYNKGRFTKKTIERMMNDVQKCTAEEENKRKELIVAQDSLESYCSSIMSTVEDEQYSKKIAEPDKNMILETCRKTLSWIESNPSVEKEDMVNKQKELECVFDKIIAIASNPAERKTTYHEILNVSEGATSNEIENAYKKAISKYHPDKYKGNKDVGNLLFNLAINARKRLVDDLGRNARAKKFRTL